jgi:hypothetical protein
MTASTALLCHHLCHHLVTFLSFHSAAFWGSSFFNKVCFSKTSASIVDPGILITLGRTDKMHPSWWRMALSGRPFAAWWEDTCSGQTTFTCCPSVCSNLANKTAEILLFYMICLKRTPLYSKHNCRAFAWKCLRIKMNQGKPVDPTFEKQAIQLVRTCLGLVKGTLTSCRLKHGLIETLTSCGGAEKLGAQIQWGNWQATYLHVQNLTTSH